MDPPSPDWSQIATPVPAYARREEDHQGPPGAWYNPLSSWLNPLSAWRSPLHVANAFGAGFLPPPVGTNSRAANFHPGWTQAGGAHPREPELQGRGPLAPADDPVGWRGEPPPVPADRAAGLLPVGPVPVQYAPLPDDAGDGGLEPPPPPPTPVARHIHAPAYPAPRRIQPVYPPANAVHYPPAPVNHQLERLLLKRTAAHIRLSMTGVMTVREMAEDMIILHSLIMDALELDDGTPVAEHTAFVGALYAMFWDLQARFERGRANQERIAHEVRNARRDHPHRRHHHCHCSCRARHEQGQ